MSYDVAKLETIIANRLAELKAFEGADEAVQALKSMSAMEKNLTRAVAELRKKRDDAAAELEVVLKDLDDARALSEEKKKKAEEEAAAKLADAEAEIQKMKDAYEADKAKEEAERQEAREKHDALIASYDKLKGDYDGLVKKAKGLQDKLSVLIDVQE